MTFRFRPDWAALAAIPSAAVGMMWRRSERHRGTRGLRDHGWGDWKWHGPQARPVRRVTRGMSTAEAPSAISHGRIRGLVSVGQQPSGQQPNRFARERERKG
jgi:hypothetical protein